MPIPVMVAGAAKVFGLAKMAWDRLPEEMQMSLRSDAMDFGRGLVCKKSAQEWAETFIEAIDKFKEDELTSEEAVNEGLSYAAGKLTFSIGEPSEKLEIEKVRIAYELYFQNNKKVWKKKDGEAFLAMVYFTPESLTEIKNGGVSFEISA